MNIEYAVLIWKWCKRTLWYPGISGFRRRTGKY